MNNPAFQNVSRPAYELPNLLKKMGEISAATSMTENQANIVMAVETHATNALSTILDGMEAMGSLLTQLGAAGDDLPNRDLCNLGNLFTHLAVEAQLMVDIQSDMMTILNSETELGPVKKGGKK